MKKFNVALAAPSLALIFLGIPAQAKTAAAGKPAYTYVCDDQGLCEGLPTDQLTAAKTDASYDDLADAMPPMESVAAGAMPSPKMATGADINGDGAASTGDLLDRPNQMPTAYLQSTAIQGQIRDVDTFLDGFRNQAGIAAADGRVSTTSQKK